MHSGRRHRSGSSGIKEYQRATFSILDVQKNLRIVPKGASPGERLLIFY